MTSNVLENIINTTHKYNQNSILICLFSMFKTSLSSFYKNKVIFVTGCSGFLGTVVVEKLLRSFTDLEKIILLIRPTRKLTVDDRITQYTQDIAFSRIQPNILSGKISWMIGDLSSEKLGLSEENLKTLCDSVNVVLHCAATVKFNEPIKNALTLNLKGTQEILKIASTIKNLESFMYVSSCFSNCNHKTVEEKLYANKFPPEVLLKMLEYMDENSLNALSQTLVQDWPNTYTFSKNVSELLVNKYRDKFPIGVFRPSIIIPSYKEPFPSWLQNDIGFNFMITGASLGLVKVFLINSQGYSPVVPVDMTANALLAAAWEVSQKNNNELNIYNYSPSENCPLVKDFLQFSLKHAPDCKFQRAVGIPKVYFITKNHISYNFLRFCLHTVPGYIMDIYLKCTGKEKKFEYLYRKYDTQVNINDYFLVRMNWIFIYNNMDKLWNKMTKEEQELLYFDLKSLNWEECLSGNAFGFKKYRFKEPLTENEEKIYTKIINNIKM